ncbi:allantoate permease [Periconia macrospinosa]|uniref:Allantoate permease n=1 Tax=Periconia macrospinosa TaxID=97972 RepID=A0A2V1DJQ8_9PLEO|nr:allantoate permease [Periconia macrospinosa]
MSDHGKDKVNADVHSSPQSIDVEIGPSDEINISNRELELERAVNNYVPDTDAEKRFVRKLDLIMMPTLWFMYILAYIDRQNIGNAKVAGMYADLQLTDEQYAMLVSIFFIGYLICEVPSNLLLTRSKPSWYMSCLMVGWGTICALMGVVHNYSGALAIRFFLGAIEAGFFPGVLFLMTCWYKKSEIGKRFSIFYTASVSSGALSGLLAGAITGNMEGVAGIRGWRWLYIIEGCVTVAAAVGVKFIILDFPENTSRFSPEERQLAIVRMAYDRKTTAARGAMHLTHWQALKAAVADPRTYIFIVLAIMDLASCTISYFIPTIVQTQMGFTSVIAQYMTIPIWMVGFVFLIILSFTADRSRDRRWHITACLGLCFVCTIVSITVSNTKVLYAMLCLYIAGLYAALPLILTWTSETIALPSEKRAVVVALVNSIGNLSSVYGSRLWPSTDAPKYTKGFAVVGTFTGFGAILAATIPILLNYLPKEGQTKAEKAILEREQAILGVVRPSDV